jgi:hypothetical protein
MGQVRFRKLGQSRRAKARASGATQEVDAESATVPGLVRASETAAAAAREAAHTVQEAASSPLDYCEK